VHLFPGWPRLTKEEALAAGGLRYAGQLNGPMSDAVDHLCGPQTLSGEAPVLAVLTNSSIPRSFNKCNDDIVHAGVHLHGNIREALHQIRAGRRSSLIDQALVFGTAQGLSKHFASVHEKNQRVASFHGSRIKTDGEIENREVVLAIRGKIVAELHSAASTQRKSIDVRGLIAGWQRIPCAGPYGNGLTDRKFCSQTRRTDVLIEKRRRDAQRRRDIVKAVHFVFSGRDVPASISTPSKSFTAIPYSVRVMR
jgi:hypothetical protein